MICVWDKFVVVAFDLLACWLVACVLMEIECLIWLGLLCLFGADGCFDVCGVFTFCVWSRLLFVFVACDWFALLDLDYLFLLWIVALLCLFACFIAGSCCIVVVLVVSFWFMWFLFCIIAFVGRFDFC